MLKWLSNMVGGNKNKTCIYAKSLQGAGKSTLPEFIRDYHGIIASCTPATYN